MKRKLTIFVGIFILLMGTAMILPALGNNQHRNEAAWQPGNYFEIGWARNGVVGMASGIPPAIGGIGTRSTV